MPKALDITGKTFGHLTAIKKMPSQSGKTYWEFQCDCGNTKVIQTGHVTSGKITDCGCNKNKTEERICPICGKVFQAEIPRENNRKYCIDCSPSTRNPATKNSIMRRKLIEERGGCCEKCGYNRCYDALEFHHIDPSTKEFNLSISGGALSYERMKAEADKCQLLCANCHREEHAKIRKEQTEKK